MLFSELTGGVEALHIDRYVQIRHVDGWGITLRSEPSPEREKLLFVKNSLFALRAAVWQQRVYNRSFANAPTDFKICLQSERR